MRREASIAAVVVSAACYATLAVLARLAYAEGMRPLPMLAWRFASVAVLMALLQAARDPGALAVGWAAARRFALLALVGYGMGSICFFYALLYADASVVAVLLYAYPALVTLAAWVFEGRAPDGPRLAALALTFAGCVLVIGPFGATATSARGITLGLGAALGYGMFSYLSQRWMGSHPRIVLMTYMFGVSAVLATIATLVSGGTLSAAGWSPRGWMLLAAIVAVPTFAAVVLYLEGIRKLGAAQAAIVSTMEPLFTIALAAALLGERMGAAQWVGASLVVVGVLVGELGERATGPAVV